MQLWPSPSKLRSRSVFKIDKHFFLLLPCRSLFSASLKLKSHASPSIALCLPRYHLGEIQDLLDWRNSLAKWRHLVADHIVRLKKEMDVKLTCVAIQSLLSRSNPSFFTSWTMRGCGHADDDWGQWLADLGHNPLHLKAVLEETRFRTCWQVGLIICHAAASESWTDLELFG